MSPSTAPRYGRISREVASLLERFSVNGPPVPVQKLAEGCGATVVYHQFDKGVSGVVMREGEQLIIGIAENQPPARQRFTLAHELGHSLLHDLPSVHVDKGFGIMFRSPKSSAAVDVFEIEANAFAAELLMPETFLSKDLKAEPVDIEDDSQLASLAARYGVSTQALHYRLLNLFARKRIFV